MDDVVRWALKVACDGAYPRAPIPLLPPPDQSLGHGIDGVLLSTETLLKRNPKRFAIVLGASGLPEKVTIPFMVHHRLINFCGSVERPVCYRYVAHDGGALRRICSLPSRGCNANQELQSAVV
uniref:Uncharacterized protein n=1 Tax=Trypanosoma congolense (strain IL3000) TaxID=1068625 RepID=G0UV25_TRYCI|nr:hypothetical protein, unlikely [Trypanosoma congolense IL3000]